MHHLLYLLALVPPLFELLEHRGPPAEPHAWVPGAAGGLLALVLVHLLVRARSHLAAQAVIDPLTGLFSRRRFDQDLPTEVTRAERQGLPLTVATVDVDRFRAINERFGHQEGEQVLVRLGKALQRLVRGGVDTCYRIGWDEFCVLMPGASEKEANIIIERIWHAAHGEEVGLDRLGGGLSIGLAAFQKGEGPAPLLRRAEQIMFETKQKAKRQEKPRTPGEDPESSRG